MSEETIKKILEDLPRSFMVDINTSLFKEITEKEFSSFVIRWPKGKLREILVNQWWKFLPYDEKWIKDEIYNKGATKGLISLIPKDVDLKYLNYWRAITHLTSNHKIFAQILQRGLQPIFRDIISPEQTDFFSLRFILDNIVLTQKALHWAKTSKQPTVFFKLNLSKAYDKLSWHFLFSTMRRMG